MPTLTPGPSFTPTFTATPARPTRLAHRRRPAPTYPPGFHPLRLGRRAHLPRNAYAEHRPIPLPRIEHCLSWLRICLTNLGGVIQPRARRFVSGYAALPGNQGRSPTSRLCLPRLFPVGDTLTTIQIGSALADFPANGVVTVHKLWNSDCETVSTSSRCRSAPTLNQYTGNDAATRAIAIGQPICQLGIAPDTPRGYAGAGRQFRSDRRGFSPAPPQRLP